MAKVFTKKVVIPGNKIDEYFEALEETQEEIEPFREYLTELNEEFEQHLTAKFSKRTAHKHCYKIGLFIDFLCWDTDVKNIDEITRGIANSYFRRWYMSKVGDCTESELKTAMKKFFLFLDSKKGITNDAVLKSFKKRVVLH